jgi:SAM-dependent methyltransferase
MTLVEPDRRLVRYLTVRLARWAGRVTILPETFERVRLPRAEFDLGVAASSFHWVPERRALRKVARLLRPGGWWAMWGNEHGDPVRPSAFHRAIQPLYRELSGRAGSGYTRARVAKQRRRRLRALASIGAFDRISRTEVRWTATLSAARVRALWATFSEIVTLPAARRTWFLRELERIADEQFSGTVEIPVVTPVYTARRR